jgi:alpha-beta hydrolase superfamily lysophospholipase
MGKEQHIQIGDIKGIIHNSNIASSNFIIACHGLFSSKGSKKYIELGKKYCQHGYNVLRFDFRGCGKSMGSFHQSTLTNRLHDLRQVLLYLRNRYMDLHVGLFGSSMGGVISILTASQALWPEIKALVVWSTPISFTDIETLPLEFRNDLKKYYILDAVSNLPPILIIHGIKDNLVPLFHARTLYKQASMPKKINIFDTDHGFSSPMEREKAISLSLSWYDKYLP